MYTGAVFHLPGQELRTFEVCREAERKSATGRIYMDAESVIGTFRGILAAASPTEIERWRQLEHPVTHKIIQQGVAGFEIRPGDTIRYGDTRYIVQTEPYNPGGINHWTIYYCDKRGDV